MFVYCLSCVLLLCCFVAFSLCWRWWSALLAGWAWRIAPIPPNSQQLTHRSPDGKIDLTRAQLHGNTHIRPINHYAQNPGTGNMCTSQHIKTYGGQWCSPGVRMADACNHCCTVNVVGPPKVQPQFAIGPGQAHMCAQYIYIYICAIPAHVYITKSASRSTQAQHAKPKPMPCTNGKTTSVRFTM